MVRCQKTRAETKENMKEETKEQKVIDTRVKDLERAKKLWQDKYAATLVEIDRLRGLIRKRDNRGT